jgi:hypothetical protein
MSIYFLNARPPQAQSPPLIARNVGTFRWRLDKEATTISCLWGVA